MKNKNAEMFLLFLAALPLVPEIPVVDPLH